MACDYLAELPLSIMARQKMKDIGLWPTLVPRDAVKLTSHILEVK